MLIALSKRVAARRQTRGVLLLGRAGASCVCAFAKISAWSVDIHRAFAGGRLGCSWKIGPEFFLYARVQS